MAQHGNIDWRAWRAAAKETSFARCNRLADERKCTHYQREAAIVDAHAVDGVLYGWSEIVEPVPAVERMRKSWWQDKALWEDDSHEHSSTEHRAIVAIRYQLRLAELMDEVIAEKLLQQQSFELPLRERLAKRGLSLEDARAELWAA